MSVAEVVADEYNNDKEVVFKVFAPFTHWITEINNTQIGNAKDINTIILTVLGLILNERYQAKQ